MTHLVLVSGSMAAGKSTVSERIVERLRSGGVDVAFTALDTIADMARPTLPEWQWAHDIHAEVVGLWAATGIDVVVDEGASSLDEVRAILTRLPADIDVLHVVVMTSYERALLRATADPTRGISKDPEFLRAQYDHFATQLPLLPCDLLLEVTDQTPTELADAVLAAATDRWPDLPHPLGERSDSRGSLSERSESKGAAEPHPTSSADLTPPTEELLTGGNASGAVVRVGDTIRKPWLPTTGRQVALMEAVRAAGVDCPKPLGRDEQGRLVLEFVPGHIAMDDAPLPPETIERVGRLIRRIHDASEAVPIDAGWPVLVPAPHPDLACHNDLSTWNLVVDGDRLVFIDWDGCGPSSRSWDLAWSAISFAHLFPDADPAACVMRLRALFDGYDADPELRREVLGSLRERTASMRDLLRRARRDGWEPWATMHDEGHGAHWSDTTDFIARHDADWARQLG